MAFGTALGLAEDLIDAKARKDVLRRLFQFVGVTLEDLIQRAEAPWSEIEAFRFNAGVGLGLNSDDGGLRDGSEVA